KDLEKQVNNKHFRNYNDDHDKFRIYFDYENAEANEKNLPFYTGDIESFVKDEFEDDKKNLKQKTEENLEKYYRSLEESDANEDERSPEKEAEEEEEANSENTSAE